MLPTASAAPLAFPGSVDRTEYPVEHKIALLKLYGSELAQKLLRHLAEMSAPQPGKADWSALIAEGLITRRGILILTPRGRVYVEAIARDLARAFGLHHVEFRFSPGGAGHSARCCCGWSGVAQRTRNGESSLRAQADVHLSRVGQGVAARMFECSVAPAELRT